MLGQRAGPVELGAAPDVVLLLDTYESAAGIDGCGSTGRSTPAAEGRRVLTALPDVPALVLPQICTTSALCTSLKPSAS